MVSFIADPRIESSQSLADILRGQSLTPYKFPPNPYAGSPVLGNLQRLAEALAGRWAGKQASELQTAQQGARSEVLAALLSAQRGTPGAQQYARTNVAFPAHPGATQRFEQRVAIDDTGAEMLDPSVLKAAGLLEGEYDIEYQEARLAGRETSEANRIAYATEQLGKARTDEQRRYWYGQVDALKAAEREFSIVDQEAKDAAARKQIEFRARFQGKWARDNSKDGIIVPVSDADLFSEEGQERYTRVNVEQLAKPPATFEKWQRENYEKFSAEAIRLGIRLEENEQILEMFKSGTLKTGSLQPLLTWGKGFLADLGISVEGLTPAQVFEAAANQRALQMRNPKSGFGLTGNTSDQDLRFLQKAVIHLSKTEAANEALLIMESARDRRLKDIAEIKMRFIQANPGKGVIGVHDEINDYVKSQPLLTQVEKDRLNFLMENNPIGGAGRTEEGQRVLPTTTYVPGDLGG